MRTAENPSALAAVGEGGVGGELETLPPHISASLWNSIVTGKRPWRHGVDGIAKPDEPGHARLAASFDRRASTLWDILSAEGLKSLVVGGAASHPAQPVHGIAVSEAFFHHVPVGGQATGGVVPQSVWPPELAADLVDLRVHPNGLDPQILRLLVPDITQTLVDRDPRLLRLANATANLYSTHNVAASLLETEEWDFAAVYFPFLGEVLREFSPFMEPRHPEAPLAAFQRYRGVVEAACRLQDLLLGDLLAAAGPNVRVFVVSGHGHRHVPPDPTAPPLPDTASVQNRRNGIFAAHGPGIRPRAGVLSGASVLDIAPTILHLHGLPVGNDMDGRVLREILTEDVPAAVARVPSWDDWTERPAERSGLSKMVFPDPTGATVNLNAWNRGMDLLDAGLAAQALPLLEQAVRANPEAAHTSYWLARCQIKLGLTDQAKATVDTLDDLGPSLPSTERLRAILALEAGQPAQALEHLAKIPTGPNQERGDLPMLKALALQQSGKWLEAAEILQTEAADKPAPEVWLALARCYLTLGRARAAVAVARQFLRAAANQLQPRLLLAHCLVANGEKEEGWQTLLAAQQMKPGAAEVLTLAKQLFPDRAGEWQGWAAEEDRDTEETPTFEADATDAEAKSQEAAKEPISEAAPHGQVPPDVAPDSGATSSESLTIMVGGKPYVYRAPEANEVPRATAIFGQLPLQAGKFALRVWETPAPKRFAGAAGWILPEEATAEAQAILNFRPGFCEPEMVEAMLRPLFSEMKGSGCRLVRVLTSRRAGWDAVLQRFGLKCVKSDEVWLGDAERAHQTLMVKLGHWHKEIPPDIRVREITESDWDFITHDCAALEFMGSGNLERTKQEFAADISCIVESDAGREGVLVATRSGMAAVLEFFGKSRTTHQFAPWVTQLSFRRFFRRDPLHAIDQVAATIDLHKGEAGSSMLRRLGGSRLLQTVHHFTGELVV